MGTVTDYTARVYSALCLIFVFEAEELFLCTFVFGIVVLREELFSRKFVLLGAPASVAK